VVQATRRVDESRATLASAVSQRQQVGVRQTQVDAARGRLDQALANLSQTELNLAYATIRAPMSGRVTKKTVEVGQVVQPGQLLLAVVDLSNLWVVGNFKETDLTMVRAGQPATITVDTYPGVVFRARVDSIQAGSGAVFSLLPPENASGNFVKVVQRVPVKLVFEPGETDKHALVPGMSVVPTITVGMPRAVNRRMSAPHGTPASGALPVSAVSAACTVFTHGWSVLVSPEEKAPPSQIRAQRGRPSSSARSTSACSSSRAACTSAPTGTPSRPSK